jgi:hypothetical protein
MRNVLKSIIGGVAPVLASALGGPLAGTAVQAIADKLGLGDSQEGTAQIEAAIVEKLEVATTDDWLKIRDAENDFKLEMRKLDIDEDKIHQMDRDSARNRQVKTDDKVPDYLALMVLVIFAGVLASVLWMAINEVQMNQQVVTVINILLGILSAGVTSVLAYYFGSSKGSQIKTHMLGGK